MAIYTLPTVVAILLAGSVLLVAGLLVALIVASGVSERRLRNRANHDHRVARGTQHLKQLERPLAKLERDMTATRSEIKSLERRLSGLAIGRRDDLEEALSRHLVTRHLTAVDGIGPGLRDRIVRTSFRGKLRDLRHAHRIPGVGPSRQRAIMRWVETRERELPTLMRASFPRKAEIMEEYDVQEAILREKLTEARETLEFKEMLHKAALEAATKLRSIQASHFVLALRHNAADHSVPNWYLEGVFPAWESAPDWFVSVLKDYGG